jgi:hypothetical protein
MVPTSNVLDWIPQGHELYVLGLQEMDTSTQSYIYTSAYTNSLLQSYQTIFEQRVGKGYMYTYAMVGIAVIIWSKTELQVEFCSVGSGMLGMANKGNNR